MPHTFEFGPIYTIFQLIQSKQVTFNAFLLPSHLDDEPERQRNLPTPDWVTDHHIRGNGHADRLVEYVRKHFDLSDEVAKPVVDAVALVKKIQRRLAAVICNLPHRKKYGRSPKPVPEPKPSVKDRIAASTYHFDEFSALCL